MAKKSFAGALSGERKSRLAGIVSPSQPETVKEPSTTAVSTTAEPKEEIVETTVDSTDNFPLIPEEAIEELRQKAAKYAQDEQQESATVVATKPVVEPTSKVEEAPREKSKTSPRKVAEPKDGGKDKMNLFIETGYEFGIRVRAAAASEMMDLKEFVETALTHYMHEVIGLNAVNRAVTKYKERNNLK